MANYAKCKWCGKTFEKSGWNQFVSHNTMGMGGKESYCSAKCKMEAEGNNESASTHSSSKSPHSDNSDERNLEAARVGMEKERHEADLEIQRKQQAQEEQRMREQRADELRAQGRTTQAFITEHIKTIGIVALILAGCVFFIYQHFSSISKEKELVVNEQKAAEIHLQLESLEDQIKLAVQSGDKGKALELANQLVHPMHIQWKTENKGFFKDYPYYDDWWEKKRLEYKDQILSMNNPVSKDNNKTVKDDVLNNNQSPNSSSNWIVILGSFNTQSDAINSQTAFSSKFNVQTEVLNSNEYPNLTKNLFIVIGGKNLSNEQAKQTLQDFKGKGIEGYIKDAGIMN